MIWPKSEAQQAALDRLFSRICEVATLPHVAQRVIEVARNEKSTNEDLRSVIQRDPALVAKVLRRVNSSLYGLPHRVSDISKAIILLGFREIQAMAFTVFASKLFDRAQTTTSFSREGLWNHSVGVGVVARMIASVCGLPHPDEAYVAGLLHDLGYIILDQYLPRHFGEVVTKTKSGRPTWEVENEILTFDHALLGAFVARRWNFPDEVVSAIGYHDQSSAYEGPHVRLVECVALANYLCHKAGRTSLGVTIAEDPPPGFRERLKLDETGMDLIKTELVVTLDRANTLASL